MLADVVRRRGAIAGSLDGWGWREMKALPLAWFDALARILSKVDEVRCLARWFAGCIHCYDPLVSAL